MRAAWLLAVALVGCHDWQVAIDTYNAHTFHDAGVPRFDTGHRCGENADCKSMQCFSGQCVDSATPSASGICGDADDCVSTAFCEPNIAGDFHCNGSPAACAPAGRVVTSSDSCHTVSNCPFPSEARGICQHTSCAEADAGCTAHGDCCEGLACSSRDAGTCVPGQLGSLPNSLLCTAADQCSSGFCLTSTRECQDPVNCVTVGHQRVAGTSCCQTPMAAVGDTCCISNAGECLRDSSCCSGQCLSGRCAAPMVGDNVNCRQRNLPCGDDNDCCVGLCDAKYKQCSSGLTNLLDGGTCTVDVQAGRCTTDAGVSCTEPREVATTDAPCCTGVKDSSGACP